MFRCAFIQRFLRFFLGTGSSDQVFDAQVLLLNVLKKLSRFHQALYRDLMASASRRTLFVISSVGCSEDADSSAVLLACAAIFRRAVYHDEPKGTRIAPY